ncbi:hypothetical protein EI94DRAFT_1698090 [Lactarius quietus]|nr:hypothetical protein EI94DRAFT_1698090 [Lactarius quietus]
MHSLSLSFILSACLWFHFVVLQLTTVQTRGRRMMFPPLLPSDNLRPLPPPIIAELQWGEPRSEAIGTGTRIAGSVSLWLVLLPLLVNCGQSRLDACGWSSWRRGKWGRAGVANLSFESWPWRDTVVHVESATIYQAGVHGTMLLPPPPLLPFDDLRLLPPPIIAELQWGEPRSKAFGTVNPDLTPAGGQVGEEESGAGREWQTCRSLNPCHGETLLSPSTGWSPWGNTPTFLHCRPLGRLPFTAVADSQWGHWGELHLEAFGADAHVGMRNAGLYVTALVGLMLCVNTVTFLTTQSVANFRWWDAQETSECNIGP